MPDVGRRKVVALLGSAVARPLAARAQRGERVRRVGALYILAADDREAQARNLLFEQSLHQLG